MTENADLNSKESKKDAIDELKDTWMIRDCSIYKDEYKECTSFRGRFHQYFIHGETLDCHQWKRDYDNCCKWAENKDLNAAEKVIESENGRREARFRAHYRNNVWTKRDSPPPDWDRPLPEWMAKRDQNTYLAIKAKEIREGKIDDSKGFCSVM